MFNVPAWCTFLRYQNRNGEDILFVLEIFYFTLKIEARYENLLALWQFFLLISLVSLTYESFIFWFAIPLMIIRQSA